MLPSRPVTHIVHVQCSFDFLLKCGVHSGMVTLGTLRGERREKYPQLSDPELTIRPRQQLPLHEGNLSHLAQAAHHAPAADRKGQRRERKHGLPQVY